MYKMLYLNLVFKRKASILAVSLLVICYPALVTATDIPSFTIEYLGTFGGRHSSANALNDKGQVVGDYYTSTGENRAFYWDSGIMRDIGVLVSSDDSSIAWAINNKGQVTGLSYNSDRQSNDSSAFLWDPINGMIDLGSPGPGFTQMRGNDINDQGLIAGMAYDYNSPRLRTDVFIWDEQAGIRSIGSFHEGYMTSEINAINNNGQVVGRTYDSVAFVATEGKEWTTLESLQPIEAVSAFDINDKGKIVGSSGLRAIMWDCDGVSALPNLFGGTNYGASDSTARAINEQDWVVGSSKDRVYGGGPHAVLWISGEIFDLNDLVIGLDSETQLWYATDINEHNQIVGYIRISQRHNIQLAAK